jgi:hypothetical protein
MRTPAEETRARPCLERRARASDRHADKFRRLEETIGLTPREALIFDFLVANAGRYVDELRISTLTFGMFDGPPGPAAVRERICGIRDKCLSRLGMDLIRFDPDRGYGLVAGDAL